MMYIKNVFRKLLSQGPISVSLAVVLSVLFVTGLVNAATTISTNIVTAGSISASSTLQVTGASTFWGKTKVGTDTSTNAVSLTSNASAGDFGLEAYTKLATDMAGGWYSASNSYMTVPITQTGNTSVFGSISELDFDDGVTHSSSNAGAMWADLELLGTTNAGASNAVTPTYSGAIIATVKVPAAATVPIYRDFAGIIVDSNLVANYTNAGSTTAAVLIRKSSGKVAWPVGLMIKTGSVTTDIQLQSGDTIKNATASSTVVSGAVSVATTTTAGILNLGPNTSTTNASTTIMMGKIQFDGYNSVGARYCAYLEGAVWAFTTGACTP